MARQTSNNALKGKAVLKEEIRQHSEKILISLYSNHVFKVTLTVMNVCSCGSFCETVRVGASV